jgi:hypothetical protein
LTFCACKKSTSPNKIENKPQYLVFPEESIKTYLTFDEIFDNSSIYPAEVQDFDFALEKLYIHPITSWGLFGYDLQGQILKELVSYGGAIILLRIHNMHFMR